MANLTLLCRFHHHRHHLGRFQIRALEGGELRFETRDGVALEQLAPPAAERRLPPLSGSTPVTPRALDGGGRFDFPYAVNVLAEGMTFHARAALERGP